MREAFLGLEKALKMRRLYEPGHPTRRQVEQDLVLRFGRALELVDTLRIKVTPDDLRFGGRPVLVEDRRERSIPFRLHQDGVRSISFVRGLKPAELFRLIEILEISPAAARRVGEDLATLLWREDLTTISYVAVDEVGFQGEGYSAADLEREVGELRGRITSREPLGVDAAEATATADEEGRAGPGRAETETAEVPVPVLAKLRNEIERDDAGLLVRRVLDILFELFRSEDCALSLEELRQLLVQLLVVGLEGGDLTLANGLLQRLADEPADDEHGALVRDLHQGLLQDLSGAQGLAALADGLSAPWQGTPEAIEAYLGHLPPATWVAVARMARELPPDGARDALRRALVAQATRQPEALSTFVEQISPDEAHVTLGEFYRATDAPLLAETLLAHADPRVRLHAVKAIGSVAEDRRQALLSRALADDNVAVRSAAAQVVEALRDRRLLPLLVSHADTLESTPEEVFGLYHAIAVLGGPDAVECLRRHLAGWISFLNPSAARLRHEAVLCLRDVTDPYVRDFLLEGSRSWNRGFAAACKAAVGRR